MPHKINDDAVLAVATAMAKAHHGEDATDPGGYMQAALTLVAGMVGLHDSGLNPVVEDVDPDAVLADTDPVQEPVEPPPAAPPVATPPPTPAPVAPVPASV